MAQKAQLVSGLKKNFYYRAVLAFADLSYGAIAVIVVEDPVSQSPAAIG